VCGVVGWVGAGPGAFDLESALRAMSHRGPDASAVVEGDGWALGHVRLAIVDLDRRSDQPMRRGKTLLSFNGEVWNHAELREELVGLGWGFSTSGDTEVVVAALDQWGEAALPRMNGMFALAWSSGSEVRIARDRFGEVPLHIAPLRGGGHAFSSEIKALPEESRRFSRWVGPGEVVVLARGRAPESRRWHVPSIDPLCVSPEEAGSLVGAALAQGCRERTMADVPVCTLLSGGVDSSTVAAMLKQHLPDLVAFTAVMDPRSPDLKRARRVAAHLEMRLVEVEVRPPTTEDLAACVEVVEMPHKAQVEIAWACISLADAMRSEGFKVTYSGEGSDELWGSYDFARHAIIRDGWHAARRDLFLGQHRKNFPRCNKVFMSRSIECRLPFLSPGLVDLALRLPVGAVRGEKSSQRKAVMARAAAGLIPDDVAARPRLAFQVGLGLREEAAKSVADPERYYRAVFAQKFGGEP
jgi:asparagine synthase (glutamine-hydrolysing)